MKILIAEDEQLLLKTIEFRLKKEGYEVISTQDGKQALEYIQKEIPDLIITDIMMPYASGMEIINFTRQKMEKHIPVIMLSGMEQEQVKMEAFDLGADDYITKPFSLNELAIRVKKLLANRRN